MHHVSIMQLLLRGAESSCIFAPGASHLQHVRSTGEKKGVQTVPSRFGSKEDPKQVFPNPSRMLNGFEWQFASQSIVRPQFLPSVGEASPV